MNRCILILVLSVCTLVVISQPADARMGMARGLGKGWKSNNNGRRRPWDRHRNYPGINMSAWNRRPTGERYRQLEEMDQQGVPSRRLGNGGRRNKNQAKTNEHRPCVGVCQYHRSQGLTNH